MHIPIGLTHIPIGLTHIPIGLTHIPNSRRRRVAPLKRYT